MKKLITLVVAGCMVLGSLGTAAAIDVKVAGQWWFHYGYYSNNQLVKKNDSGSHVDRTLARQRVRTQISFIADENLSALLNLEGNNEWGRGGTAGSGRIDADNSYFVIKRAHLDWTIPNTQVKTRMGIQGINMPTVAFGNPVLNADVAGITVSSQLTPELGLTVFWARPYDREAANGIGDGQRDGNNNLDDMDVFGITLPIKTDVVRLTPWAMFSLIGKDSDFYTDYDGKAKYNYGQGLHNPYMGVRGGLDDMDSTTYGWWAGTTFELPVLDPFFVKIDAMMGGLETGASDYDTFGYLVAADIGYKFSWGSVSVAGWYASGNDDEDDLGFMPIISDDGSTFNFTRYGVGGTTARSYDSLLTTNGIGMWGIGLKIKDVSFVENLTHAINVAYMGGTNKADSLPRRDTHSPYYSYTAKNDITNTPAYMSMGNKYSQMFGNMYFMSSDRAWEIDLLNEYKVNENLKFHLDFAYLWLDLGDHWDNSGDTEGSFATMVGVQYSF